MRSKTMPQRRMQQPAGLSIGSNMLINTLMRDRQGMVTYQPTGDLLWAPLMVQFTLDQPTATTRPFERTTDLSPALLSAAICSLSKVAIRTFIAFQLPRDRRTVYANNRGNLTGTLTGFVQGRYLVSLR